MESIGREDLILGREQFALTARMMLMTNSHSGESLDSPFTVGAGIIEVTDCPLQRCHGTLSGHGGRYFPTGQRTFIYRPGRR